MYVLNKLGQGLIFLPTIFCFSYILRPILMVILIPGGLALLALIGGAEVRAELKGVSARETLARLSKKQNAQVSRSQYLRDIDVVKRGLALISIHVLTDSP